jgi:hypothetical protein
MNATFESSNEKNCKKHKKHYIFPAVNKNAANTEETKSRLSQNLLPLLRNI